jgi:predicted RecB family nuclease
MPKIGAIEGIGETYQNILKRAGIRTVESLLDSGATAEARRRLCEQTGVSDTLLLNWINMADLFRLRGIASQYAELLKRAGVDTVTELAQRNPPSLHERLVEGNRAARVVRRVPALTAVESWIAEAKLLPRRVHY